MNKPFGLYCDILLWLHSVITGLTLVPRHAAHCIIASFFFLLHPAGCWGMGEMKNTVQPVSLIAIKLLWLYNTSGPPVLSVKNTEQQVRPGETRDMNSDWANFPVISYCALVCVQNVMLQSLIRVDCLCWYRKIHSNSVTHWVFLQDNTEAGKSVSVFFFLERTNDQWRPVGLWNNIARIKKSIEQRAQSMQPHCWTLYN